MTTQMVWLFTSLRLIQSTPNSFVLRQKDLIDCPPNDSLDTLYIRPQDPYVQIPI